MSDGLAEQARNFAKQLTKTISAIAPTCSPFEANAIEETARFEVTQTPDTGIPLLVGGRRLLVLKVFYACCLDGEERYLAVDRSHVKVFQGSRASGEPLFRFDYVRHPRSKIPAAHIQVHAHRDALTYVMSSSGSGSTRGRRRASSDAAPRLSELHFPVGGHRFRPCLEDVVEFVATELGVDVSAEGLEALQAGRDSWRRQQTRTVVRDSPAVAARVLEELGYGIKPPAAGHPAGQPDRLRDL